MDKEEVNLDRTINKKLMQIAFPMAIEGLASACGDLADTLMVSSLGEISVAAVGLGSQLFFIQNMIIYGFTGGASTFMSQYYGEKNYCGIKRTLSMTVVVALILSGIIFVAMLTGPETLISIFTNISEIKDEAVDYMRIRAICLIMTSITLPTIMALKAMQKIKTAVFAAMSAVVINVVMNYVLIFGKLSFPAMGIKGAALATSIATVAELIILLILLFLSKSCIVHEMEDYLSWNKVHWINLIKNSIPTSINELMWSAGMAAYTAAYGRINAVAVAATQAADIVTHVFTKTIYSVGDASLVLVGEQIGREEVEYSYILAKKLLAINTILGLLAGLLLYFISAPVAALFNFSSESTYCLIWIMRIYGLFLFIKVYNVSLITGIFRAGGDVGFAMATEVSTIWLIGVPIVFVSAIYLDIPVYVIVLLSQAEDIFKSIILTRRFVSKKWINNKIKNNTI